MSDSTGNQSDQPTGGDRPDAPPPGGAPYGQQGHERNRSFAEQYGQPQGQEPANPYGQPQPYGQPAYGQPAYGGRDLHKRPGTVTTAGVLTLVFSSLSLLLFGLVALAFVLAEDIVMTEMGRAPGMGEVPATFWQVFFGIIALWSLIGIVLGVLALRRSHGGRIALVVSAVLVILFCIFNVVSAPNPAAAATSVIMVAVAATTIICLFTGGASEWYAARKLAPPQQGGRAPVA